MSNNKHIDEKTIGIKPGAATVAADAADRWGRKAYELNPIKNLDPTKNANVIDAINGRLDPSQLTQADWDAIPSFDEASAVAKKLGLSKFTYQVGGNTKNMSGVYSVAGGSVPAPEPVPPVPPGPVPPIPITPEIAIIGLITGAGLIAAIKALNNTIKSRFRKCCKVLYQMQQDFVSEHGCSMSKVMPGIGSKFTDLWAWFKGPKGKSKNKGTIGIMPFLERYEEEINLDYRDAINAFNSIAIVGKSTPAEKPVTKESVNADYNSFAEAIMSDPLYEGIDKSSIETRVDQFIDPKNIYANGSNFIMTTSDGKTKTIQVTKESTREVCCAIINQFLNKYINTKTLFKNLGLTMGLGEVDKSNVAKFEKLLNAYKSSADTNSSKMFARIEKEYNQMIKDYISMGDRLINNFEKYTKNKKGDAAKASIDNKGLSEKDDNLLFDSCIKLRSAWRKQQDYFENNFGKVLVELTKSKEYQAYINFILEKVMPIFKTGLAGDADPILDIVPKKGEYYFVRQTQQQNKLEGTDKNEGNVALVEVTSFDFKSQKISFKILGKVNGNIIASNKVKGQYEMAEPDKLDESAYLDDNGNPREITDMNFAQWNSMDPYQCVHDYKGDKKEEPKTIVPKSHVYTKDVTNPDTNEVHTVYVFAEADQDEFREKLNPAKEENVEPEKTETTNSEFKEDKILDEDNIEEGIGDTVKGWFNKIKSVFKGKDEDEVKQEISKEPSIETIPDDDPAAKEFHTAEIVIAGKLKNDANEKRFSGAIKRLANTRSETIEEFCKKMEALGYKELNDPTIEGKLRNEILNQRNSFANNNEGNVKDVDTVVNDEAVNKVVFTATAGEQNTWHAKEIAEYICNVVKSANIQFGKVEESLVEDENVTAATGENNPTETNNQQTQPTQSATNAQAQNQQSQQNVEQNKPIISGDFVIGKFGGMLNINDYAWKFTGKKPINAQQNEKIVFDINSYNGGRAYLPFVTTYKDVNNVQLHINIYPVIIGSDNKIITGNNPSEVIEKTKTNGNIAYCAAIKKHSDEKGQGDAAGVPFDINNINAAENTIKELVNKMIETKQFQPSRESVSKDEPALTPESINISYADQFSLAESFASGFMSGANYLKVYRTINMPKSKTKYFVLSENAWGDGVTLDPEKYLVEHMNKILVENKSYDDLAKLSKQNISINLIPVSEDCSYKTRLPYNRYQMLTQYNPLYESSVILSFDIDNNINSICNLGVHKIYKNA